MEPIPEEDDNVSPVCSFSMVNAEKSVTFSSTPNIISYGDTLTSLSNPIKNSNPNKNTENDSNNKETNNDYKTRTTESKQRLREIYTTEEVDTLVSTLPENSIPEEWNNYSTEEVVTDPKMTHTYVTELAGAKTSARGNKYCYTYESHIDEPEPTDIQYTTTTFGETTQNHVTTTTTVISPKLCNGNYSNEFNNNKDINELKMISEYETLPTPDVECHSTSTQKVTRVTKITTTRSVRQTPLAPEDIYFDSEGNPILNDFNDALHSNENNIEEFVNQTDAPANAVGIDLSRTFISEHEEYNSPVATTSIKNLANCNATNDEFYPSDQNFNYVVPSASGIPVVVDLSNSTISLKWNGPQHEGTAGPIIGYKIEFRRCKTEEWEPAHDDLLGEMECKITNLEPLDSYYFRVIAANCAGFGQPSASSSSICLLNNKTQNDNDGSLRPSRPIVIDINNNCATIKWHLIPPSSLKLNAAPIVGYMVEYRPAGALTWTRSNDYPVPGPCHQVENLRPNGEYEFQIFAKDVEGYLSLPSLSSGLIRINSVVPIRNQNIYNLALQPPGQPQIIEIKETSVKLDWAPSLSSLKHCNSSDIGYLVECREIDELQWRVISPQNSTQTFQIENNFIAENLHIDSSYEFRVSTILLSDGSQSLPSDSSEIVRIKALAASVHDLGADGKKLVPERPSRPEYLDFDGGTSVTLCWIPAKSVLPIIGYEPEFRDIMQNEKWNKFTENDSDPPYLIQSCKTTVANLVRGHQYQFRIFAHNANGQSPPSDSSPLITIGASLKDAKYVEAERYGAVSLLQDEMIRESPPLPDRDDSPPPFYRQLNGDLRWRDPTLKEVVDYLKNSNQAVVQDASAYLQHLTFNNDAIKEDTRNYGGISNLVDLLKTKNLEILRNSCGCLKNLAFGKNNDENKKVINQLNGVSALAKVVSQIQNLDILEEASGALWNISSADDLKEAVLNQAAESVTNSIVIPFSGFIGNPLLSNEPIAVLKASNIFRNGVGILRNVSAANSNARKILRALPNLIDSILHFLGKSIRENQLKSRSVENCICILRNLSYRVQEVVDPKYDPNSRNSRHNNNNIRNLSARERSKSAPSNSPKSRKLFKKSKKEFTKENSSLYLNGKISSASLLWHPETVKLYLHVLQECTSTELLESSASAIQNLAACAFEGSAQVRATVRLENGLPVFAELLQLREDKVVCAVVTAVRNLVLDPINLLEIGNLALVDLIQKLPEQNQTERNPLISEATIGAVLGVLWEIVRSSPELTQKIHTLHGTERLRRLANAYPIYGIRVCKYATQVLYAMWQHKELQDLFRKSGLKDSDFFAQTTLSGRKTPMTTPINGHHHDASTLARPISSQGLERPAKLRRQEQEQNYAIYDQTYKNEAPTLFNGNGQITNRSDYGSSYGIASPLETNRTVLLANNNFGSLNNIENLSNNKKEPVYASVLKKNSTNGGIDSWV